MRPPLPTWLWAPAEAKDFAVGRPRVLLSVDRRWVHRVGFTRVTFHRLLRWAGARVRQVKYTAEDDLTPRVNTIMDGIDGLVLSGGGDVDPQLYGVEGPARNVKPQRDRFELELIRIAIDRRLPILAICRGSQLLNVALGGTLKSLRETDRLYRQHNNPCGMHRVAVRPNTRLAEAVAPHTRLLIRSVHGQCVDRVAEGLEVAAMSADGTIESTASRLPTSRLPDSNRYAGNDNALPWIVAVQWHPELVFFRNNEHLLVKRFVEAAAEPMGQPHRSD